MSYPIYNQLLSTARDRRDDKRIDYTTSGGAYGRAFYTSAKRRFTVQHILSRAEYATLDTHYTDNRTTTFTFVWQLNNTSYTVMYESPPKYDFNANAPYVGAQVVLVEA